MSLATRPLLLSCQTPPGGASPAWNVMAATRMAISTRYFRSFHTSSASSAPAGCCCCGSTGALPAAAGAWPLPFCSPESAMGLRFLCKSLASL
uniref:Uncharacterized protein n=1 Tax=Triticum urartu TaxID=4572 RepID=A0A8R7V6Q6_TRIUA